MRIEHIAIWTADLDRLITFYTRHFGARAGPKYVNPGKGFASCFLSFEGVARLELMTSASLTPGDGRWQTGYAHFALSVGSEIEVDTLTGRLKAAGVTVIDGPRRTGDGYYESVLLDPDGNRVEITT